MIVFDKWIFFIEEFFFVFSNVETPNCCSKQSDKKNGQIQEKFSIACQQCGSDTNRSSKDPVNDVLQIQNKVLLIFLPSQIVDNQKITIKAHGTRALTKWNDTKYANNDLDQREKSHRENVRKKMTSPGLLVRSGSSENIKTIPLWQQRLITMTKMNKNNSVAKRRPFEKIKQN